MLPMGFFLLLPFFLLRFGLLARLDRSALRRAAQFAPMYGRERAAYWVYQISTGRSSSIPFFSPSGPVPCGGLAWGCWCMGPAWRSWPPPSSTLPGLTTRGCVGRGSIVGPGTRCTWRIFSFSWDAPGSPSRGCCWASSRCSSSQPTGSSWQRSGHAWHGLENPTPGTWSKCDGIFNPPPRCKKLRRPKTTELFAFLSRDSAGAPGACGRCGRGSGR